MVKADDVFCKIVRGENPVDIIYEDDKVMAFLDEYPKSEGHTLVIPKKHAENIYDIDEETLVQCHRVAKRIAVAMKKTLKVDGILIMQANEPTGLQHIFHLHVHVIPKYLNDKNSGKNTRMIAGDIKAGLED